MPEEAIDWVTCAGCQREIRATQLRTPLRCWRCVDRAVLVVRVVWTLSPFDLRQLKALRIALE